MAEEAKKNPELVKSAPHTTRIQRLDEVGAARKPILRWKKGLKVEEAPHEVVAGPVVPTC